MAPLTRNRSPHGVQTDLGVAYYRQRASAGLIVTEATAISAQGQGYADVPGLHEAEQLKAWRRVTDAVHAAGGLIRREDAPLSTPDRATFYGGGAHTATSTTRPYEKTRPRAAHAT